MLKNIFWYGWILILLCFPPGSGRMFILWMIYLKHDAILRFKWIILSTIYTSSGTSGFTLAFNGVPPLTATYSPNNWEKLGQKKIFINNMESYFSNVWVYWLLTYTLKWKTVMVKQMLCGCTWRIFYVVECVDYLCAHVVWMPCYNVHWEVSWRERFLGSAFPGVWMCLNAWVSSPI